MNIIKRQIRKIKNQWMYNYKKSYYERLAKKGLHGIGSAVSTIYYNQVNNEGYIIKEDIGFTRSFNTVFAAVSVVEFGSLMGSIEVPYIATDEFYNKLSDNTKRFLIAHELHHFYEQKEEILNLNGERNLYIEAEADMAGVKAVGFKNAIKALNEMKEVAIGAINVDEIDKRVKMIVQNYDRVDVKERIQIV